MSKSAATRSPGDDQGDRPARRPAQEGEDSGHRLRGAKSCSASDWEAGDLEPADGVLSGDGPPRSPTWRPSTPARGTAHFKEGLADAVIEFLPTAPGAVPGTERRPGGDRPEPPGPGGRSGAGDFARRLSRPSTTAWASSARRVAASALLLAAHPRGLRRHGRHALRGRGAGGRSSWPQRSRSPAWPGCVLRHRGRGRAVRAPLRGS